MTASTASSPSTIALGQWAALLQRSNGGRIFALPGWKQAWQSSLGADETPLFASIEEEGRLVALAPMARTTAGVVRFAGGPEVSDRLDFAVEAGREGELTPRLLDQLAELDWSELRLDCLAAHSPTAELTRRWAAKAGLTAETEQQTVCPLVHLAPDWDGYLAALGKKDRHELRRKLRRLDAAGEVSLRLADEPNQLRQAMDEFLRLMRLSDPEKDAFLTPDMERFFRAMLAATFEAGVLRLWFLNINGTTAAGVICFDDGSDELQLYNSGFDPAFRHLSAGLLLKVYALREAIRLGKRTYNTLRGNERYKYDLGAQDSAVLCVRVIRQAG